VSGFDAPNYTQVPNALFAMMASMGESELKIVLCAVRLIFGYHKTKPEAISYSQFEEMTGLNRGAVAKGVKDAIKRGVLRIAGNGKRGVNIYEIAIKATDNQFAEQTTDQFANQTSQDDTSLQIKPMTGLQIKHTKERKEKETTLAPLARSIHEVKICPIPAKQMGGMVLDTSQLPKIQLDDKELNKRVRAIITTYLSVSGTVKSNAHALWNADAKQLVLQGIDNKHIAKFISEKRKEPFFSDKSVTWNVVTSQIVTWNQAYEKAQERARQADLHTQMGVTRDDFMLPDLYNSPFDLKYPDEKAG
jgi:hypothetical protein